MTIIDVLLTLALTIFIYVCYTFILAYMERYDEE